MPRPRAGSQIAPQHELASPRSVRADSAGMSLAAMRERAEAIGDRLTITSAPQQGTTVEVTVAFEADARYDSA